MARPFRGEEHLEAAFAAISQASTVEQLRQAQALVLPLHCCLSLEQTAQALGISPSWVSRLRNEFIAGRIIRDDTPARGGRHHENFSVEQEAELLRPFIEQAAQGGILVVGQIKPLLEQARGKPIALSSVYNLLHRHGWRKLAPDKRHPKSNPQAQEEFKKNSPRSFKTSARTSHKAPPSN
jgi:transposase